MKRAHLFGVIATAVVVAVAATGCSSGPSVAAAGSGTVAAGSAPSNTPAATGAATQSAPQSAGATIQLGTGGVDGLIAEYNSRCKNESVESVECEALRSLLVAEVTTGLLKIEKSGDQRGTEEALYALDLADEPEILVRAMRVLGHFPETPNVAAQVVPLLLDSPYIGVQDMAASVLLANPDQGFKDLGQLWTENHHELLSDSAYDEYPDFPAHYDSMAFPQYPAADWFSPGDSDRSIGWSSPDDFDKVVKWFADTLHVEAMTPPQWGDVLLQQSQLPINALIDPARMARQQQLMDRLMRGDQTAQPEMDKLTKEFDALAQRAEEAGKKSIVTASSAPPSFAAVGRWFVVKKKGERISQLILVFPMPALKRTGIRYIWDLSDYPSAWPEPKKEKGQ
jgi:hypothetical protein